ncbi:hypothetical protein BASA62_001761 [Batrachochytrium salamandrivorans]|nr:hypothetical protein BASA62_001761 [Batrachochytrium salamandrivorans]
MFSAQSSLPILLELLQKQVTPVSEPTTPPSADTNGPRSCRRNLLDPAALTTSTRTIHSRDYGSIVYRSNKKIHDDEEDELSTLISQLKRLRICVMTSIPMQPSLLRYGKNLDGPARDSIRHTHIRILATFAILTLTPLLLVATSAQRDDEEDDDDYICSDDDELEDEMEPLTIKKRKTISLISNLLHLVVQNCLHNSAKVLRHGKEIMLPGDVDSLSTKIETLMQTTTSGNEESGIDNMVM